METTLFGAERNGGGFIKETRDTMEIIHLGIKTLDASVAMTNNKLQAITDKKVGAREVLKAAIPSLLVATASVIAVILSR